MIALLTFSCSQNNLDVDVSNIDVGMEVLRMEKDLFGNDKKVPADRHQILLEKYGSLYEIFFESMLREGSVYDPMASSYLDKFITNSDMQDIYYEMTLKFDDFSTYEKGLEDAFKHYKYYFPDSTVPVMVTFYSNFNANIFPMNDTLAIGLDMYLGTKSEIVKSLPIESLPQFVKDKMEPEYLVSDAMKFWLFNKYFSEKNDDFMMTVISTGKVLYLLDAMLPDVEDHIKLNYTKEEYDWCKENEMNIWQTIVDNDILYANDQKTIMQYITDGPFTKGLPQESPSRVGYWLGLQMVRDYMAESGSSVLNLLNETNYRKILKEYDPNE